jgi:Ca-activated chloride channel family protein
MLEFLWPWLALAWPLPLLIRWFWSAEATPPAALRVPFLHRLQQLSAAQESPLPRRSWAPLAFALLLWTLLVIAALRPQWVGDPIELPVSGRSLMLAVDLSGSMKEEDLQLRGDYVTRLTVVQSVLEEFIARREGDRLGLILFGEQAYLQTPLTFDRNTIQQMLREAVIGLAGERTAIGNAIGLGVKRLQELEESERVLILLTDGANTAGDISPGQAARLAAQAGIRIYTIGVGADEMLVRTFFGTQRVNPSRDLDEQLLQSIAVQTGGRYFRARSTQELAQIYQLLDELEPVERDAEVFRPLQPLYLYPLGLALLLSALWVLRDLWRQNIAPRLRKPAHG